MFCAFDVEREMLSEGTTSSLKRKPLSYRSLVIVEVESALRCAADCRAARDRPSSSIGSAILLLFLAASTLPRRVRPSLKLMTLPLGP